MGAHKGQGHGKGHGAPQPSLSPPSRTPTPTLSSQRLPKAIPSGFYGDVSEQAGLTRRQWGEGRPGEKGQGPVPSVGTEAREPRVQLSPVSALWWGCTLSDKNQQRKAERARSQVL